MSDQFKDLELSDISLQDIKIQQQSIVCSKEDIKNSISLLGNILPTVFSQQLANIVYSILQLKNKSKIDKQSDQYQPDKHQLHSQSSEFSQQKRTGIDQKSLHRLIAKGFCEKGYGLDTLKKQLRMHAKNIYLQKQEYIDILNGIVMFVYNKLEQFLLNQGYIKTLTSDPEEKVMINQIGINCRTFFKHQICQSFFNTIKCMHDIRPYNPVTLDESNDLYIAFRRSLDDMKQRQAKAQVLLQDGIRRRSKQQKFELHLQWNQNFQKNILQLYRKDTKMSQIRKIFIDLYPQQQHLFSGQALRSKLCKIIRLGLKKLMATINRTSVSYYYPKLIRLDDRKLHDLLSHSDARSARLLILDVYEKDFQSDLIRRTVTAINQFFGSIEKPIKERVEPRVTPLYHPKFMNGRKKYGTYNGKYEPTAILKSKQRQEEKYAHRIDSDEDDKQDCHSDNQSVYSIF